MVHELLIIFEFLVAIIAVVFLVVEETHMKGYRIAFAKKMTEKEKVATSLLPYLLRLMPEAMAYARPTIRPKANGIHTGNAAAGNTC
jgi:hypothetical protein